VWWDRSEWAEVYLAPTCVGLRGGGVAVATWIDTVDLNDAVSHLVDALARGDLRSCGRVRVWLGAELARPLILDAGSGARTRAEANALATMQAPDLTGLEGTIRVWVNGWRKDRGGLAVAMPENVWVVLQGMIEQAGTARTSQDGAAKSLKLISLRPWWNQVMDVVIADSAREGGAVGWSLTEDGCVVHGIVDNGVPLQAGFDVLDSRDAGGAKLRRRLQVNWNAIASSRHMELARQGEGVRASIGSWRPFAGGLE